MLRPKYPIKTATLVLQILTKLNGSRPMPTEANEVYECEICGAVVEVKEGGAGDLECCGQPMTLKE